MSITIRLHSLIIEFVLHILCLFLSGFLWLTALSFFPAFVHQFTSAITDASSGHVTPEFFSFCTGLYYLFIVLLAFALAKLDVARKSSHLGAEYWLSLCLAFALFYALDNSLAVWLNSFYAWYTSRWITAIQFEFCQLYYLLWLFAEGIRLIIFWILNRKTHKKRFNEKSDSLN